MSPSALGPKNAFPFICLRQFQRVRLTQSRFSFFSFSFDHFAFSYSGILVTFTDEDWRATNRVPLFLELANCDWATKAENLTANTLFGNGYR